MENASTFLEKLEQGPLQAFIEEVKGYAGEITVVVKAEKLHELLKTLKDMFQFEYLADITASDHYTDERRFEVAYNIVSFTNKQRLRVSTFVEENNPVVDTVVDLWESANWYEREAFDMVGVRFNNHPDLRRIFMPEDFEYYPLRKEFPLLGIPGSIALPEKDPPKTYN